MCRENPPVKHSFDGILPAAHGADAWAANGEDGVGAQLKSEAARALLTDPDTDG